MYAEHARLLAREEFAGLEADKRKAEVENGRTLARRHTAAEPREFTGTNVSNMQH